MDIEPRMVNNIAHSAVLLNKPIMYIPCPPYSSLSNKLYQITVIIATIIEKARWFRIKTIVLIWWSPRDGTRTPKIIVLRDYVVLRIAV